LSWVGCVVRVLLLLLLLLLGRYWVLWVAALGCGGHWLTLVHLSLAWDWVRRVRLLQLAHLRGIHVLRVSRLVVLGGVGLRVLLHAVTLLSQRDLLAGQWM
jgi:hypothetical protein